MISSRAIASHPICGTGDSSALPVLALRVGANDVTMNYHAGSGLGISSEINARDTLDFEIFDTEPPALAIDPGSSVSVIHHGVSVFEGTVDEVRTATVGDVEPKTRRTLRCVDFNQLADRRLVNDVFVSTNAGAVATALVNKYLADDGVTVKQVANGATIDRIVFQYVTVAAALDELTDLSGGALHWEIDFSKNFFLVSRGEIAAPFDLSEDSQPIRNAALRRSRSGLRNRQVVRGGFDRTASQVETIAGDGESRSFNVRFRVAEKPTAIEISRAGGAFTQIDPGDVGVQGIDQEKRWYYSKGSPTITQDSDETVLAGQTLDPGPVLVQADRVRVTYVGQFRVVVIREDAVSILERQGVEGGSGIYERVQADSEIESGSFATVRADGLLERFSKLGEVLDYETDKPGLRAGQIQSVSLSSIGASGAFLITNVSGTDRGDLAFSSTRESFRWRVKATNAGRLDSWIEFWRALIALHKRAKIDEDEVLDLTVPVVDSVQVDDLVTVDLSDTVDPFGNDPHTVALVGTGVVGKSEFGDPPKS